MEGVKEDKQYEKEAAEDAINCMRTRHMHYAFSGKCLAAHVKAEVKLCLVM